MQGGELNLLHYKNDVRQILAITNTHPRNLFTSNYKGIVGIEQTRDLEWQVWQFTAHKNTVKYDDSDSITYSLMLKRASFTYHLFLFVPFLGNQKF